MSRRSPSPRWKVRSRDYLAIPPVLNASVRKGRTFPASGVAVSRASEPVKSDDWRGISIVGCYCSEACAAMPAACWATALLYISRGGYTPGG